ncbi:hypothetical protein ACTFIY_008583 [Dictyostelium cf. discoideum]
MNYDTKTSNANLEGLKEQVLDIKSQILEFRNNNKIIYPNRWDHKKEYCLVEIEKGGKEWLEIHKRMLETLPGVTINKVEFVQNRSSYEDYYYKKNKIEAHNGKSVELYLFHGTRTTQPESIYYSKDCFDWRFSKESCMWGNGSYFAYNASYSHSYSYKTPENKNQFFIATVLSGDSITLEPDSSLKLPPLKDSRNKSVRYDSVNGNTQGSDVYIVYDNQQSYPYYLVTYTYNFK